MFFIKVGTLERASGNRLSQIHSIAEFGESSGELYSTLKFRRRFNSRWPELGS